MFKISPIQDKDTQIKYANACGTDYKEGYFAYQMTDSETGELMGFSQFEITGSEGYIADLLPAPSYSDFEAMFILGRATMNFIDLCGAHKARATSKSADEGLLRCIGFKLDENDIYSVDMTGMFDGKCDGKTVKLDK